MKLRAPSNISGVSIAGQPIEISRDGSVDVTHEHAAELIGSHGFEAWDKPTFDIERANRQQLEAKAIELLRIEIAKASDDELRQGIMSKMDRQSRQADRQADSVTVADMDRSQLFAYCKAHGIAIVATTTTDAMRAIALEAEAKASEQP